MAYACTTMLRIRRQWYDLCKLAHHVDRSECNVSIFAYLNASTFTGRIIIYSRFIYNVAVRSGIFDLFRRWMITNTPPDQRVILLVIGFSFGSLLEGVAGSLMVPYVINDRIKAPFN